MIPIRVLLIEDSPVDAQLVRGYLAAAAPQIVLEHAPTLGEGLERLAARDIDAILLDLHLPDASGLPAIVTMKERYPAVPIVVLTALEDESMALRAMRQGAQDYLVKGRLDGAAIVRALRFAIERMNASAPPDIALRSAASELRTHLDLVKAEHAALQRLLQHPAEAAATHPAPVAPGLLLQKRYVLGERLGKGSYGEAFLARDQLLERQVVVKLLHDVFLPESDAERQFVKEARLLASLEHPHVIRVYDFGFHGATPFYVMEYAEGGSLAHRLRRGPVARGEALRVVDEMLQGLQYVHSHGVLHRDLKPANILLGRSGDVKIGDFGMALLEAPPDATADGLGVAVVGTPAYAPPESMRAEPLTPASDLFAVGAILFELLTGAPYAQVSTEGAGAPWRRLKEALAGAPDAETLAALVRSALDRKPERRPRSAMEMRLALQQLAA